MKPLQRLLETSEHGQTVVEYAMLVGLVSLVIIGVLVAAAPGWISSVTGLVTTAIG